jgi:hypothetical protein
VRAGRVCCLVELARGRPRRSTVLSQRGRPVSRWVLPATPSAGRTRRGTAGRNRRHRR